jgi:hypothetical protein
MLLTTTFAPRGTGHCRHHWNLSCILSGLGLSVGGGSQDRSQLGIAVGGIVGAPVGLSVGRLEGSPIGALDGCDVGSRLGFAVGCENG